MNTDTLALAAPSLQFVEIPDPWDRVEIVVSAGAEAPARQQVTGFDIATVLAALENWMQLDVAEGAPSPLTLAAYRTDVRIFLRWLQDQGIVSVGHVTLDTLKAFRAHLARTYKVGTVRRKIASVRRFFALAHAHGALRVDPAIGLKSPAERTQRADRIRYLELDELARLIEATATARSPQIGIRDRAIITLLAYHGLRRCEIHRLDVADIDLAAGESGSLTIHGKGNKERLVWLIDESANALRQWLAVRRLMRPGDDACFVQMHCNVEGPAGRLSNQAINTIVDGYLVKTGLKRCGISCHTLRHTCATQALAAGAGLLDIGGMLGHASVNTTTIYAKVVDRQRRNPAKAINLGPSGPTA